MSELNKFQMALSKSQAQFVNEIRTSLTNQVAKLRNLEAQMGQMTTMFNERQQGNFPSTLEMNTRRDGKEHCKAVTLRSGKIVEDSVKENDEDKLKENVENSLENSIKVENSAEKLEQAEKL